MQSRGNSWSALSTMHGRYVRFINIQYYYYYCPLLLQQILADEADDLTEEEKEKLLEAYREIKESSQEKLDESRQDQRDHLMAKLAARKRLKEEVLKEETVAKELEHLSKQQVRRMIGA